MALADNKIDSRLPYRIGSPMLPVLPVETRMIKQDSPLYASQFNIFKSDIRHVLAKHRIPDYQPRLRYRMNCGVEATNEHLTLVLLSKYEPGCEARWIDAVQELRSYLAQSGTYWAIELIDHRVFARPLYTWPVLTADRALIEGWSRLRPRFFDTIESQQWVAVDVLYREFPSSKKKPTVIISARDANNETWYMSTLPNLVRILEAEKVDIDVVVLFLQDIKMLTTRSAASDDHTTPDPLIRTDFYKNEWRIGTSCAAFQSIHSATLGGKIKLQKESTAMELGLTNYHILEDATTAQNAISGPFPSAQELHRKAIVSPSDCDHEVAMSMLRKSVDRAGKEYSGLAQKLEYLTETDPAWQSSELLTRIAYLRLKALKAELRFAETMSRGVGTVFAASGHRTCVNSRYQGPESNNWALDWCLVEVNQPKSICNTLDDVPDTAHHVRDGDEIAGYCSISPAQHYDVVKRGRTTGWTRGTISAIDSAINIQDSHRTQLKTPTNQQAEFREKWGRPVWVHAIVGPEKAPQFMCPGDSGSFILLDQAPSVFVVGLGFAANEETYASYMTPFDLVAEDIEEVTGAKVIEPQFAGTMISKNSESNDPSA